MKKEGTSTHSIPSNRLFCGQDVINASLDIEFESRVARVERRTKPRIRLGTRHVMVPPLLVRSRSQTADGPLHRQVSPPSPCAHAHGV